MPRSKIAKPVTVFLALDLIKINTEQKMYVMQHGEYISCYGFDVLDKKARAVGAWIASTMRIDDIYEFKRAAHFADHAPEIGTVEHYVWAKNLLNAGAQHAAATGKTCDAELTHALIPYEGKRVRVTLPDGESSTFIVGKSTGWMPRHLEIKRRDSSGGEIVYFPAGSRVNLK